MFLKICLILLLALNNTSLWAQTETIKDTSNYLGTSISNFSSMPLDSIEGDSIITIRKAPIVIKHTVYTYEEEEKNILKYLSIETGLQFPLKRDFQSKNMSISPSNGISFSLNGGVLTKLFKIDFGIGFSEIHNKLTMETNEVKGVSTSRYYTVDSVKSSFELLPDTFFYNYTYDTTWHTRQDTLYNNKVNGTIHTSRNLQIPISASFRFNIKKFILTVGAGAMVNINISNSFSDNGNLFAKYLNNKITVNPFITAKGYYPIFRKLYFSGDLYVLCYQYKEFKPIIFNAIISPGIHYFF